MAITRIKNNQITDATITNSKLVPGTITGGTLSSNLTYEGNLVISGNLSVTGTTTVVDTVNTSVADPIIVLSRNATGSAIVDSGLIIERGDDINQALIWDESLDEFAMFSTTETGATAGDITVSAYANLKLATAKMDTLSNQAGNASPKIAGLTATRVTFAGTDGVLTDSANLTYASGNLTIDNLVAGGNTITTSTGNLTLDSAGGNINSDNVLNLTANVTSTTTTTGTIVVTGGVGISGDLNVGGNVAFDGTIDVGGISTDGNLTVDGNISGGNISTSGELNVTGNANVGDLNTDLITANTGNITTINSTTINGTTGTFTGNVSGGNISTSGELNVTGNANVGDLNTDVITANTGNITTINSTTGSFTGNVTAGNLASNGAASITGNLSAGNISTSGDLSVTGTANVGDLNTDVVTANTGNITDINTANITVSNWANITSNTASTSTTTGALIIAGGVGVAGNVNLGGNLAAADGAFSGNLIVTGNLTVDGTTTFVNTETTTVKDPVLVIGGTDNGGAATTDDNKDRGVQFQWHTGTLAKSGFFGFDDSTGKFTFIPDATISDDVVSGTAGDVAFGNVDANFGTFAGNVTAGNISTTGSFGTTGNLSAGNISTSGELNVTGNANVGDLNTDTVTANTGNITTINNTTITVSTLANITASTASTSSTTGALIVAGGTGIGGNLNVAGQAAVTGNLSAGNVSTTTLTGNVSSNGTSDFATITVSTLANVTSNTASTSTTSGALVVAGGAGVVGNVNIGGLLDVTGNISGGNISTIGSLGVTGNATTGNLSTTTAVITTGNITTVNAGTVNVSTLANITATTASTDTVTGALLVAGGVGVVGNINVGGSINRFTDTTVSNSTSTGTIVVSGGVGVAGNVYAGNLAIVGSSLISSNSNGNIEIQPDGTGITVINPTGISDTNIQGESNSNLFYVDASNDNIGVGTNTPNAGAIVHINSTDSIILPVGTSAERPVSPATGMFRFNTDLSVIEYYDGTGWTDTDVSFTVITSDVFDGDGSTVGFTLLQSGTTSGVIVSINGVVQLPTTAYTVSGTTLTFTEAPATGDKIEVRGITTTSTLINLFSTNGYVGVEALNTGLDVYSGGASRIKRVTLDNNGTLSVLANIASTSTTSGSFTVAGGVGVVGNINAGGTITGNLADVAENYQADAEYEPGTVLEFGGDAEVTVCTHNMCKRVAGVVTTAPAMVMNGDLKGENVASLALLGRVPVKVSGTVRKGDMMVSAGDGRARAEENPVLGSVIGKALEDFDGTEGVIEVVIGRM